MTALEAEELLMWYLVDASIIDNPFLGSVMELQKACQPAAGARTVYSGLIWTPGLPI